MDLSESGRQRARTTHRIHDTGGGVGAGEAHGDRTVDQRQYDEPRACAPEPAGQGEIRIGIGAEGSHIARTPADCAGIRRKDVEHPDQQQRQDDRHTYELAGAA